MNVGTELRNGSEPLPSGLLSNLNNTPENLSEIGPGTSLSKPPSSNIHPMQPGSRHDIKTILASLQKETNSISSTDHPRPKSY